jgi:hypothetical protein
MLLIFFFVFLTFYYQKVFSFHWHPPALRFISNTKPLRYYNERSQNLMECSTEEISFAKYPSSMSNKIFQGSANNNNNKKKKNMSYPIVFTNLMSCSFSCGDLSKLNESGPLEWEDCSDDVIHLHDSLRKNSFLVKAPEFKLVQIDHKKEVNKSNKLIKNIYIMRSSNTSLSQSSRIKLQVRYSLKDLQSNSYSIGEHTLDFNVIVIKNDCHDSFKSETNAGIDMLAFKEGSTVLTCSRKIMIHDNIPPQFTFCPGNREFYLKKNAMSIVFFYDRPIATDNSNNIPRIYQVMFILRRCYCLENNV